MSDHRQRPAGDTLDIAWAVYAHHVDALLEHRATLDGISAAAVQVTHDNRAECEAQRDGLVADVRGHIATLQREVAGAGQRASMVDDDAEDVLSRASEAPAVSGAVPLAVEWGDRPSVALGGALVPVRNSMQRVDDAIAGVRAARDQRLVAARHGEWCRRRRLGLARDAVLLPLVLGAAAAFFVWLYWGGEAVGPFNATIWTVAAAGLGAGIIAVFRSWILARLAGEERGTGSGDARGALLLVWGLSLLLYGPAPRPSRYDLEATLLGWLDSALVVVAPLVGLVMWACVLKDIRRLSAHQPDVAPASR